MKIQNKTKQNKIKPVAIVAKLVTILLALILLTNCTVNEPVEDEENNSPVCQPAQGLDILGTWQGDFDKIVISDSTFVAKEQIGSGDPKDDYSMTVEAVDSSTMILKLRGKQKNYDNWPEVNLESNDIYQRTKWCKVSSSVIYLCDESFNKDTLQDLDDDPASYTFQFDDPDGNHCGFGAWNKYTKE